MTPPSFEQRMARLPGLGLGISTEFGAGREGLDILSLHRARPDLVRFLEVGADLDRGVDDDTRAWASAGLPTTYHFLDVNLEDPEDLDADWVRGTRELAGSLGAAWLCGDAGLWHVGPRERGHGTLMPPVLCAESAAILADATVALREASGFEVLPENPPAHVYLGDLHLLDYFGRVAERADTPLLLDVAHVAAYQVACGHGPLTGLDDFPCERVVEMHVAGGTLFEHGGRTFVEDDHGTDVLDAVWQLFEAVLARAPHLRAVVLECERNSVDGVVPMFEAAAERMARGAAR